MSTTHSPARAARLRQVQALDLPVEPIGRDHAERGESSGHSNSKQQHQAIPKPGKLQPLSALTPLDHRKQEQQPLRLPPDEAGSGTAGPTTSSADDAKQ